MSVRDWIRVHVSLVPWGFGRVYATPPRYSATELGALNADSPSLSGFWTKEVGVKPSEVAASALKYLSKIHPDAADFYQILNNEGMLTTRNELLRALARLIDEGYVRKVDDGT